MQREGDGGGVDGRDVDAKNRLSGGRLRPMPRRRRWLLAVLEDLIGLFRGKHLLVSNRDASYLKYLKCGAAAQALLALAVYAIALADNLQSARAVRARCRDSRALPARPGLLSAQP